MSTNNTTTDAAIEAEIVAKGLTAPRVTPASIEAVIKSEHYFTAHQGALMGMPRADFQCMQSLGGDPLPDALKLLTFCVLVMRNGFTVVGKSACASPENFDAELGKKIARQDAINQVWPLEGYLLKQMLHVAAISKTTEAAA